MHKLIFFLLILCISFTSFGQNKKKQRQQEKKEHINNMVKEEEEGVIVYHKSFVFGAKLISDGYGIFLEKGIAKSVKKSTLFQLEIS